MKQHYFLVPVILLFFIFPLRAQEWIHYSGADAVKDLQLHDDQLWAVGAGGLSAVDVNTQQITYWTTVNSELPVYGFDVMSVATSGEVWLGGIYVEQLTRFDGVTFTTYPTLNGYPVTGLLDLTDSPDGKIWILGYFDPDPLDDVNLFYFENEVFTEVPAPLNYSIGTGTAAQIGTGSDGHLWCLLRDLNTLEFVIGEYDGIDWVVHDLSASNPNLGPGDQFISDSQGNVYVLVGSSGDATFLIYDGSTWDATEIPADPNDYSNQNRALYVDQNDLIWVSLANNTFLQFDGLAWDTVSLIDYGLYDGYADGLFIDQSGLQWIYYNQAQASNPFRKQMIFRYDGNTSEPVVLGNSDLPSNECLDLRIDAQNNKWIASKHGLIKFDGNEWVDIGSPSNLYQFYPFEVDQWGDLWYLAGDSKLGRYDGQVFTDIPVYNAQNEPYDWLVNFALSQDGTIYCATDGPEILQFEEGEASHLEGFMTSILSSQFPDNSDRVVFSPSGKLYTLGNSLNRLEDDGSWTEIPLWDNSGLAFPINFTVAPNDNIWVAHGIIINGGPGLKIFDGTNWSDFQNPFENLSFPKWNNAGDFWMLTDNGLCKFDGSDWTCYNETNSPLVTGAIQNFTIDQSDNIWILLEGAGILVFNENQILNIEGVALPSVSGCIYRDNNQNGIKDAGDLPLAQQKIMLLPDSMITFSNTDGTYQISAPPGDYTLECLPVFPWEIDNSPGSYDVTLNTGLQEGFDFRLAPSEEVCDLQVFLNEGFPRCNRISYNWVSYWNFGTQEESGEIRLGLDPNIDFVSAIPPPDFQDQDTLVWLFSNLPPLGTSEIYVQLQMPDENFVNTILTTSAFIDKAGERLDSSIANQLLACAYDPNDKVGVSSGEIRDGQSLFEDPIEYMIRFQNTGNDTAFTVVIRDTLDSQLDWNTFELIGASHELESSLDVNGALEFLFEDIMLPDSNINESDSHGFVSYRIKTRQNLPPPIVIENTAYIYFDLNAAIVTNTTNNILVDKFVGVFDLDKANLELNAFPNPTDDIVYLNVGGAGSEFYSFQILNLQGQVLQSGEWRNKYGTGLSLKGYPAGTYLVKLENSDEVGSVVIVKTN